MIFFRRVSGTSMLPRLHDGQIIIARSTTKIAVGRIVVVNYAGRELIKRVTHIKNDQIWIEGDNRRASTDSRVYGWIDKSDILGVMKHSLPLAVDPPKTRTARASAFGWSASILLIIFALIHLFRIDTFVPELTRVFDGNNTYGFWFASIIVSLEVFALPFLMRMKLSILAQYVSGAFAVLVPLLWLLISIWTYGANVSTAQFGEFMELPSSVTLIVLNSVWLIFSYYTIWALGYDNRAQDKKSFVTKLFSRLSK